MSTFLYMWFIYNAYNICKNSLQRAPCGGTEHNCMMLYYWSLTCESVPPANVVFSTTLVCQSDVLLNSD